MSESDKAAATSNGAVKPEDDLDKLLDSALGDFDKPLTKPASAAPETKLSPDKEQCDGSQWGKEFQQFQSVMESFLKENANMAGLGEDSAAGADFGASLAESLQALADSTQSMGEPSPEELAHLLQSMGVEDGEARGDLPDFMPLMQNVMQNLLSKELLYPALKEIAMKYPEWLTEKKESLTSEELEKYTNQYELMKQVCDEFESADTSSEEAKSKSFQKILMLMQKMQDCGNPPKELIGEVPNELPFDEEGNIKIPGLPEQCSIM